MRRDLASMSASDHDVLVVGGGIYGACLALEAATRGYRVALVERDDFGAATSFNSLRIIHGGLRYLQHLDFRRMRESIRARREWLRFAPDLLRPMDFTIPTYGHGARGREAHALAMKIADLVGWDRNQGVPPDGAIGRSRVLTKGTAREALRDFELGPYNGAARWQDVSCTSSERLLVRVLTAAAERGARLANYASAVSLATEGGRVVGARVRDDETRDAFDVRADHVINAAGPWAFSLEGPRGRPEGPCLYARAFNLVVRDDRWSSAVGIPVPRRGDDHEAVVGSGTNTYFLVPWNGLTLIGTKHVPEYSARPEGTLDPAEIDRFLDEINQRLRGPGIERDQVVAVLSGWLPEAGTSAADTDPVLVKHARIIDHEARDGTPGLTTVQGVKWTTAREVARRLLDTLAAKGRLGDPSPGPHQPRTQSAPVETQGTGEPTDESPGSGAPITQDRPTTEAEVARAVRFEMARTLSDVVLRRSDLWLSRHIDEHALRRCAQWISRELAWDQDEIERQVRRTEGELSALR